MHTTRKQSAQKKTGPEAPLNLIDASSSCTSPATERNAMTTENARIEAKATPIKGRKLG